MYQRETKKFRHRDASIPFKILSFYLCDVAAKEYISFWPPLILTDRTKRNATRRKKHIWLDACKRVCLETKVNYVTLFISRMQTKT